MGTLVKRGDPGALGLLGFTPAAVEINWPALEQTTIPYGAGIRFTATIHNPGGEPARPAIDYVIHHRRVNGTEPEDVQAHPPGPSHRARP